MKSSDERRTFARIQITMEVRVAGPVSTAYGKLRDLSKGNASVFLNEVVGKVGDTLDMFLPYSKEDEIAIMGELVRVVETPQGLLHAIHFKLVEPSMRDSLNRFIDHSLGQRGSETRRYPRVAFQTLISYKEPDQKDAILETIALGGLGMTTNEPLKPKQEIEVEVPWPKREHPPLQLSGRVVSQYSMDQRGTKKYRVGLQFTNTTPDLQKTLDHYIRGVLDLYAVQFPEKS